MTRSLRILYIALFLGILLSLGLWSLGGVFSYIRTPDATLLNGRLAHSAEQHYDAEFPVKRLGTNLWALLDFKVFHEGRPGVVLGKDQWLYTDEEFNPVANGEQNEKDNFALVEGVRDALKKQNVKLILAIIPAKTRLYPEHIGNEAPASQHTDLYQQFHASARQADILAPDLLAPLQQAKNAGPVFLRTDTHWTPMGAEVAAQQLSDTISKKTPLTTAPLHYVTEALPSEPYKGDLTTFLPLDPLFSNLLPKPDDLSQRTTRQASEVAKSAPGSSDPTGGDALFSDATVPVALVGTSYSANPHWNFLGALQQAIGADVVNYAENGHGPILPMLKYLQSDALKNSPPQVVIWEFPERYLPMANDLSDFDPKWITQLKTSEATNDHLALNANE